MRLEILKTGYRTWQKPILKLIEVMMGSIPGPIAVSSYRRALFGKMYIACLHEAMDQHNLWSKAEVELFAAFTSKNNACRFCTEHHTAVTLRSMDEQLLAAVLNNWRTAPVNEKVRATLGLLEKLTLSPDEVSPADIAPLRASGLSDEAIAQAIYICALFNVINRLADSFDFEMPTPKETQRVSLYLFRLGYGMASIPG